MTTYYDYLRDRIAAAPGLDRARLEHLMQAERNGLWQMLIANPAYDERGRMGALAAFDEAATRIFYEADLRAAGPPVGHPNGGVPMQRAQPDAVRSPRQPRSWTRDTMLVLAGVVLGLAAAYFGRDLVGRALQVSGVGGELAVEGLAPSVRSFKFVRSSPAQQDGAIDVQYKLGSPAASVCSVEMSNQEIVEYVKFDDGCRTISFKFLPLETLLTDFNYLQGYMVFTATVSAAGQTWKGTASIYFSVDATA